jgi:hypothetical protein
MTDGPASVVSDLRAFTGYPYSSFCRVVNPAQITEAPPTPEHSVFRIHYCIIFVQRRSHIRVLFILL